MGEKNYAFTWRGLPATPPTQAEMVASQTALAEESARLEAAARALYDSLPPGDPRLLKAKDDIDRYASDQKHFRRAANVHREKLLLEQRREAASRAHAEETEKRKAMGLPLRDRQFDEDVDEEWEHESAWAEIGGAVGGRR